MFYKKKGLPEESEIVLCTVTRVQHNSVFVFLDEYKIDGLIHISEVSPGRIRNIRDFVKEDKKIVCKILRVKEDKQQVDLSLRRVTESQKRNKISETKQEQTAEKIVEHLAGIFKIEPKKLYEDITKNVFEDYDDLHSFFQAIVTGEVKAKDYKIDNKIADELEKTVKLRLKPQEVSIGGILKLVSYESDGVEIIKNALKKALISEGILIKYKGSGNYIITATESDYKKAEVSLDKSTNGAIEYIKSQKGIGEFFRKK